MNNYHGNGQPRPNSGFISAHFPETVRPMTPQQTENHGTTPPKTESKSIISKFFHYTTINGLQRLASATTIIGRLFWIAVVLGALAMFSRDLYDLIEQYNDKPISVVSKINYFKVNNTIVVC